MNITDKRNDLLKRISTIDDRQLENISNQMIVVLKQNKPYLLNKEENLFIDKALEGDESERRLTKDQVVEEAKTKYPKLKLQK